jgi:hypothetical protein
MALVTAEYVHADDFIREVLLDSEVLDVLKVETLRLLYERNEEDEFGIVLCHIYRKVPLLKVQLGRKKRKRFIEAYARVASKFSVINDVYAKKIKTATESLYRDLEGCNALDLVDKADDCACAIFLYSGIKDLRGDIEVVAKAFEANTDKVKVLLATAEAGKYFQQQETKGETDNETH